MKLIVSIAAICFSVASLAAPSYLPVPRKVGPAQTPVYHVAAQAEKLKQTKKHTLYSLDVILKWGTQVYETGRFIYRCEKVRTACALMDYEMTGSYEKCSVRQGKVQCKGSLIAGAPDFEFSDDRDPHLDPSAEAIDPEGIESQAPRFDEPSQSQEERNPHFEEAPTNEITEPELN